VVHAIGSKFQNMLAPNTFTQSSKLALVSAIPEECPWKHSFDPVLNTIGPFYTPIGPVQVTYMHREFFDLPYLEVNEGGMELQILLIPLAAVAGLTRRLVIILPRGAFYPGQKIIFPNTHALIDKLLKANPQNLTQHVKLAFPKVDFTTQTFDVTNVLKLLGVVDLFDANKANLTRLSLEKGLYASNIVQKAALTISEKSTNAAAGDALVVGRSRREEVVDVSVDRPFHFGIIIEHAQDVVVRTFEGHIFQP